MLKEFRQFILRGNVVDLAVGIVIGAAFTSIVNSMVANIFNPLIAAVVAKPNFTGLVLQIHGQKIQYGDFLNSVVSFLIMAAVIFFFVVKPINKLTELTNRTKSPTEPGTKKCPECLSDIPRKAKRCAFCTSVQSEKV